MALGFGRKKANDAQQTPPPANAADELNISEEGQTSEDDLSAFDLDSFADQLETGGGTGGASRFDDVFSAPASTPPATTPAPSVSAFDFPDEPAPASPIKDDLFDDDFLPEVGTPEVGTPAAAPSPLAAPMPVPPMPIPPAPMATPLVPPAAPLAASDPLDLNEMFAAEQKQAIESGKIAPPPAPMNMESEPPTPFDEEPTDRPKKKLPLVPIVAGLVILGIAGGAGMFLMNSGTPEDIELPVAPETAPPRPPMNQPPAAPVKPAAPAKPMAPVKAAAPAKPVAPVKAAAPSPPVVKPGISPNASAQMAKLKALWKQGADAKHRGDKAAALRYWRQGLSIQPSNQGFKDSIAKIDQKSR